MIPHSFIANLLDRADIVDVIGRSITLKKSGRNFMACCPFHKEKTPSFSVSPSRQRFKCFGCGKSGNAIGFLMEYENLDYPEAIRRLAAIYGMEVPEERLTPARRAAVERAKTLSDYMKEAADFYTQNLRQSPTAIEYLKRREISGETARRFALGFSPDGWHGLQAVFPGEKYAAKALLEAGLVNEKNGRRYDAFRGRLMFPIRSPKGTVLGFGARTLQGDEQPKYLNSPETPIYHKGQELYGLFEGRDAVRSKGRAIVCEGYMDVIQLSQAGFEESVAALGTSITPEHVRKLFKLADDVYFSFDGDEAGRRAARRALEAALPVIGDTQKAHFVLLPPEHDPDSLIKAEGPQAYERELERALPLTVFMRTLLLDGKELFYAEDRAKLIAEAKPWILAMQHAPVLRLGILRDLAGLARLPLEDLEAQYGLRRPEEKRPRSAAASAQAGGFRPRSGFRSGARPWIGARGWRDFRPEARPEPPLPVRDMRDRMLQCLLAYPELIGEFSASIEEEFLESSSPAAARIVEVWRAAMGDEDGRMPSTPAALLEMLADSPNVEFYAELLNEEFDVETPIEGARLELKRAFLELELERTKVRLQSFGREGAPDLELLRRLSARRREVEGLIAQVRAEEHAYRHQQVEASAQAAAAEIHGPERYSTNPKVRALQEHLFGRAPEEAEPPKTDSRVSGEARPAPEAAPTRPALDEAAQARRRQRDEILKGLSEAARSRRGAVALDAPPAFGAPFPDEAAFSDDAPPPAEDWTQGIADADDVPWTDDAEVIPGEDPDVFPR